MTGFLDVVRALQRTRLCVAPAILPAMRRRDRLRHTELAPAPPHFIGRAHRAAVHLALAAAAKLDRPPQRLFFSVAIDGNKFAADLPRRGTPRDDVTRLRLINAGDAEGTARAAGGEEAVGARLADALFFAVAPGDRLFECVRRPAVRHVREVFRRCLAAKRDPRVPADAVPAGFVNARDTFRFKSFSSTLHAGSVMESPPFELLPDFFRR